MRKKTIAAMVSVYLTICAVYGISRGLIDSSGTESIETVQNTEALISSAAETRNSSRGKKNRSKTTVTVPAEDSEDESVISDDSKDDDTQAEAVTTPSDGTEIEEIPDPDIPTLSEYLQKLKCSGCRHKCSLANPRCMNGKRKASSAESEYYSLYG